MKATYKQLTAIILFMFQHNTGYAQSGSSNEPIVNAPINPAGELMINPSATSSPKDFDFFEGKWTLYNRVLKVQPDGSKTWNEFDATQEMHVILNGIGNVDNFIATRDGKPFEGMTLRLFNPETRLWNIYWADSNKGVLYLPPVVGSFDKRVGLFFSEDTVNDKKILTVYRWDAREPDHPVWSQATSGDNGKNWEWNWYMYFSRGLSK